jgi:alpha-tubulin suppressor-like RCC1 family protein
MSLFLHRALLPLGLVAALPACDDQPSPLVPVAPRTIPGQVTLQKFACTADIRANALLCTSEPSPSDGPSKIILGGPNGTYVRLTSSNLNYGAGIYTFDVTVQNLIPQTLGIGTNGLPDGNGVSVVFWQEPIATEGTGIITVNNAQRATFTRPDELYYRYDQTLAKDQTSASRQWNFSVPATVVRFGFSVYVAAAVQYPEGWIEITGAPTLQVARGGTLTLGAVVRDPLGRDITASAGPVVWSLTDPSVATISGAILTGAATSGNTTLSAIAGARSGNALLLVGTPFAQITAGGSHTCGLTPVGRAYCWGWNSAGQLGDATITNRYTPVAVNQGTITFVQIRAGSSHTCGLSSTGQTYCWGANANGQLGDGTFTSRLTPVAVQQGAETYVKITAGTNHSCGISSTGPTYCWGYNGYGGLGNGGKTDVSRPVAVRPAIKVNPPFVEITAGRYHSCGRSSNGQAYCWGRNTEGALGIGFDNNNSSIPVAVEQGGYGYIQITAGSLHTCGLASTGQTFCWGANDKGQIGYGRPTNKYSPVAVLQNTTYIEIDAGSDHTCGRSSAGQIYCWGSGSSGQLGTGFLGIGMAVAVQQGGRNFVEITAGGAHTCSRSAAGQAFCWGANNAGQLGDNTIIERRTPVAVQ